MKELLFRKTEFCYRTTIDLGGDESYIELDTGSPITTISIPNLLQITGESLSAFRHKVTSFLTMYSPLSLGVYGSQINDVKHEFLPYLVKDIQIDETLFPYFLFWVDITPINSSKITPTSILLGFDYIRQGDKRFDEDDNFHIRFGTIKADFFSVKYAMSNVSENIYMIKELIKEF